MRGWQPRALSLAEGFLRHHPICPLALTGPHLWHLLQALKILRCAEPKLFLLQPDAREIRLLGQKRPPRHLQMLAQVRAGGQISLQVQCGSGSPGGACGPQSLWVWSVWSGPWALRMLSVACSKGRIWSVRWSCAICFAYASLRPNFSLSGWLREHVCPACAQT